MKIVRIRMDVADGSGGGWNSYWWGSSRGNEKDDELISLVMGPMDDAVVRLHRVECDVPVPTAIEIPLNDVTVTPAKEQPE